MNTHPKKYSVKNEFKETISLSFPLVTSYLIYASSSFVGTVLVAKLGQEALAASILVSIIWGSLCVLFFGILNAVCVLVSHQHGAKNNKAISQIMTQAYLLGWLMTLLLIAVLSCMPLFLKLTSQPTHVLHLATRYMHALLWCIPGLVMLIISEGFLSGIGRAKVIMRISMLVVPIEIMLIYAFIFGKFGLPACGIAGVGYGFAVTYTITAVCMIAFVKYAKHYKRYNILADFKNIDFSYLKELFRIGLPIGFMNFIEVSTFAVTTFWMAHFGTTMLAAHQIVMQYLGFIITLVFSMSSAVAIRVGHEVGREDIIGVKYAAWVGMLTNFVIILFVALLLILSPKLFLSVDVNIHSAANKELIHNASALLRICGLLLLFENFRIISSGALRGLKDTRFTMLASFLSFWFVGLVSAYTLAFSWHVNGRGIWWGLTFGIAVGCMMHLIRLLFLLKHIDIKKVNKIKLNV